MASLPLVTRNESVLFGAILLVSWVASFYRFVRNAKESVRLSAKYRKLARLQRKAVFQLNF